MPKYCFYSWLVGYLLVFTPAAIATETSYQCPLLPNLKSRKCILETTGSMKQHKEKIMKKATIIFKKNIFVFYWLDHFLKSGAM